MPNTREKLIEVLDVIGSCNAKYCADCEFAKDIEGCVRRQKEIIADHLIANGVTVQEWISVKDRLPEKREDVLLCRKWWNEIRNPQIGWYNDVSGEWFDLSNRVIHNVTHWMPLPEPPKGE